MSRALFVLALALFPGAAAQGELAGVEWEDPEEALPCESPTFDGPCVLVWDDRDTPGIGDDSVALQAHAQRVAVRVRPGQAPIVGPPLSDNVPGEELAASTYETKLEHPVFTTYTNAHDMILYDGIPATGIDLRMNDTGFVLTRPLFAPFEVEWGGEGDVLAYRWVRGPDWISTGESEILALWLSECLYGGENSYLEYVSGPCRGIGGPELLSLAPDALPSASVRFGVEEVAAVVDSGRVDDDRVIALDKPVTYFAPTVGTAGSELMEPEGATTDAFEPTGPTAREPVRSIVAPTSPLQPVAALSDERTQPSDGVSLAAMASALLSLLLASLYQRLLNRDLLNHPKRRALHDVVAARPGISLVDAGLAIGTDHRGADHHVRKLERAGLLVARRGPQRVELYLPGQTPPRVDEADAAVAHPIARRLLLLVARRNGATRRELREALGMPRQTVEWHVRRLVDAGILADASRGPVRLVPERRESVIDVVLGFERALRPPASSSSS